MFGKGEFSVKGLLALELLRKLEQLHNKNLALLGNVK